MQASMRIMKPAASINAEQRELWNAQTADYWVRHKSALDKLLQPLTDLLLEAADLSGSEQVADIGCGTGATTLQIASALDDGGHVIGIDISKQLIHSAVRTAEKTGVKNVSFIEADAARFAFDKAQDLLIALRSHVFWRPHQSLFPLAQNSSARRSAVIGSLVRAEENEWYQFPMQSVEAFSDTHSAPDYDAPGAFTLAKKARVRDILNTAGFTDINLASHQPTLLVGSTVSEAANFHGDELNPNATPRSGRCFKRTRPTAHAGGSEGLPTGCGRVYEKRLLADFCGTSIPATNPHRGR